MSRPTVRPAPDLREQIARIVEPQAFAFLDRHAAYVAPETVSGHAAALAKADAILALPALAGVAPAGAVVPEGRAEDGPRREFLDLLGKAVEARAGELRIRIWKGLHAVATVRAGGGEILSRELDVAAAHGMLQAAFEMAGTGAEYRVGDYQGTRLEARRTEHLPAGVETLRLHYDPLPDGGRMLVARPLYSSPTLDPETEAA